MKSTTWATGLSVSGDGVGVVAHAGGTAVRLLAEQVGLTRELSGALSRRGFVPGHDRGQVLVDVATMLAGGGEAIADIDTLRHQEEVLGSVASAPTVWRALDELTPARLKRVEKARARTRARVWELAGGPPAARAAGRHSTLTWWSKVPEGVGSSRTVVPSGPRRRTRTPVDCSWVLYRSRPARVRYSTQ